ncbi:MAG: DNA polymerase III subunit beta [Chitinophagaceae bacterium]|nr:DNA polymerase III subunit beta [Chitinophagaceae bacterium]
MKFIVSSTQLLKNLQQISGVLNTNTVLPILLDFLFEIQGNELTVKGTDLETTVKVKIDIEAREDGRVCIPARILMDSLRNIPEQPLTFTIDKSYAVEITSDTGKYKIMGENPENYPKDPDTEESVSYNMPATAMHAVINKCLFAAGTDSLRPAMAGVFFELSKKSLTTVATDAHRLAKLTRTDIHHSEDASFIVPKKPLLLMKNLLPVSDEELTVSYNSKHMFVSHGNSEVMCRLIDARYPDYRVVIPSNNPYKLIVNKSDFELALRRVSVFSNKSTYLVALTIAGSELTLESQDVDLSFEGNERMSCQYEGEDMQIAFNAKTLIEMLAAADTDEVVIELTSPTKPGILRPYGNEDKRDKNEDLLMLLMPLVITV